jgi:hypothetical protein
MPRLISLLLLGLMLRTAVPLSAQEKSPAAGHWSLQALVRPAVGAFADPADAAWVRNPIDSFVLSALKVRNLRPAPEADRATLVRRATFDLTGLPPTPAELDAALADTSPDWYERIIDRLLTSPHHGEKWGRHWLDVVRYAESEGFEYDRYRPGAWRYRDWVIAAFNADMPYDRFILEQLAGDELAVGADSPARAQDLRIAAGFHRLGPVRRNAGNQDIAFSRNEVLTEMTDIVGTVFLGLTVGCARCHDHKFDAISLKDYYQLQAFFAGTQEDDVALADPETHARWKATTARLTEEIDRVKQEIKDLEGAAKQRMEARLKDLQRSLPPPLPTISSVCNLNEKRTPIHVLKRGDPAKKGEPVGPRVLNLPKVPPVVLTSDADNPRTHLARWLTHPDNPLTARVLVNRLWQYHFGKGIVATANDFGVNGARPTHPELLDWLAVEFRGSNTGWRIKPIHRLIVTSSTYRQSSTGSPLSVKVDPDGRFLSRFPARRLSAEEVRDAMLHISGRLNRKPGGPSIIPDLVQLLYDPKQWKVTADPDEHNRRSVYLTVKRNLPLPFGQTFDQPDAQTSCACREQSTHPLQALELLNGKTALSLAESFALRLEREAGSDPARQIELAYRLVAGRPPTPRERQLALEFLREQPLREFALALFNINAFLYVK